MGDNQAVSSYLASLPASFQVDPFLGRFLLAFERLLSGFATADDPATAAIVPSPGLEQTYENVHTNFDPEVAPEEFLPWLATWVATSLKQNWDVDLRRRFIANMASLYRRRGTKGYLTQLLSVYLNDNKTLIVDDSDPTPHFFKVSFSVSADPAEVALSSRVAQTLIEQEKPAHTFYSLTIKFPTMQIIDTPTPPTTGPGIIVGTNTILGSGTVTG